MIHYYIVDHYYVWYSKTILDSTQVRHLARCATDPATTSDLWDAPPHLKKPTVADRLLAQAGVKLKEEIEWGGDTDRYELQETKLQCGPSTPTTTWEKAISLTKRTPIYTDGSRSEEGVVGGGYYLQQGQLGVRVGTMATVWDGEITGMKLGLRAAGNTDEKVIILSDSKAAIQAIINAGRRGKARTRDQAHLVQQIRRRQDLYGQDNVAVGWVKAHVGIEGNERADEMAKMGAAKEGRDHVTEGGLRQWEKTKRRENRVRIGHLDATKWDRHTASTYTQLRTNRGNLVSLRKVLGKADRDVCRWCKRDSETGEHLVFDCIHWDFRRPTRKIGEKWRKWKSWEDLDLKVWVDKGGEGKKDVNHVYIFFSELPLDVGRGSEKGGRRVAT